MNDPNPSGGWDWPHIIPRKLVIAGFIVFNVLTAAAIWVEYSKAAPGGAHWFILWNAVGGNASGVWFWLISGAFLYSEVVTMVLTILSNRARVRKAAAEAAAKAAADATAKAKSEVAEAALKRDRMWREWNERREAAAREGRDFTEPPPEPPSGNNKDS